MRFARPHQIDRLRTEHPLFSRARFYDIWPFAESASAYARNWSHRSLSGDLNLAGAGITRRWGSAHASAAQIQIGPSNGFFQTNEASFLILYRREGTASEAFFATRNPIPRYTFLLAVEGGNAVCKYKNSSDVLTDLIGAPVPNDGTWQSIFISAKQGFVYIVQNGRLIASSTLLDATNTFGNNGNAQAHLFSRGALADTVEGMVGLVLISDAFVHTDVSIPVSQNPWSLFETPVRRLRIRYPESVEIIADPVAGIGTMGGTGNISVSIDAVLTALGQLSAGHAVSVSRAAEAVFASGLLAGADMVSVVKGAPLSAISLLEGAHVVSVLWPAAELSAFGELDGRAEISVNALDGTISASGEILGRSILGVVKDAQPLIAAGTLLGDMDGHVTIPADPVAANTALLGGPVLSVIAAADPVQAAGHLLATGVIDVNIAAKVLDAAGELIGVVDIPGGIVINADAIEAAGEVSAEMRDVIRTGVVSASGVVIGYSGLSIPLAPLTAAGALTGDHRIGRFIDAEALEASGEISADIVLSVLRVADAILANGALSGTARVRGSSLDQAMLTALTRLPDHITEVILENVDTRLTLEQALRSAAEQSTDETSLTIVVEITKIQLTH